VRLTRELRDLDRSLVVEFGGVETLPAPAEPLLHGLEDLQLQVVHPTLEHLPLHSVLHLF